LFCILRKYKNRKNPSLAGPYICPLKVGEKSTVTIRI
jgi:hypothetical protein